MKNFAIIAAVAAFLPALAFAEPNEGLNSCPTGTQSCNITEIGDRDYDNSQTVGDTLDNTYAPDSANASSSTGPIDVDAVGQGGASTATATGNTSSNDNKSTANNSATNNQTNGNISNNVTGGNITSSNTQSQGQGQGQSQSMGDQAATTNSGNVTSKGGAGGKATSGIKTGNIGSVSKASGGRGGAGGKATGGKSNSVSKATGGSSRATGGNSNSGGNTISGGNSTTNVDASQRTTIKHAAAAAQVIDMGDSNIVNCFGDMNPSGQFGASIQTFGWGVTANASKAGNVCAMARLAGPRAAIAYMAEMDPNARRALLNNGMAITKAQAEAARAASH